MARIKSNALPKLTLIVFGILLLTHANFAATITSNGTGGGNWTTGASWSGGIVPGAADDVIITASDVINLTTNQTCNSISLSGTINFNTNTRTLTVNTNFSVNSATASLNGNNASRNLFVLGNFTVNANRQLTIQGINLDVTGITTNNGAIIFTTSTAGGKNFNGNFNCNSGTIDFTIAETITLQSNLALGGTSQIGSSSTATGIITLSNNLTSAAASIIDIANITINCSGNASLSGQVTFSNLSGNKTITGNVTINSGASIPFTAAETISILGNLSCSPNCVLGNGSAIGIIAVSGDCNILTGGTTAINNIQLTVTNLAINGNAVLDASAGTTSIQLSGNWTNTSSAADPFVEGSSSVSFTSTTGSQTISAVATETFYNLTLNNTSLANPNILFNQSVATSNNFIQTSARVDLKGNQLICMANTSASVATFNGPSIISSVNGGAISITEPSNNQNKTVSFNAVSIGDATRDVNITTVAGKITWVNSTFYGVIDFTKTQNNDDVFAGGNTFYRNATFTANSSASRWRMGDNNASPDTFYGTVIYNANATGGSNNNFIVGANSIGNQYFGAVYFNSTTSGGLYIGRGNGSGNSSVIFHGPVYANVQLTGAIAFADAAINNLSSVEFRNTIQLSSSATSTGDISLGVGQYSTVLLNTTAQLVAAPVLGATTINCRNVTQLGSTLQTLSCSGTSIIDIGFSTYPCTFNGDINFTAPQVRSRYSTYNGTTINFTQTGSSNNGTWGGNYFSAATNVTFRSTGTAQWNLGSTAADDFDGNVNFIMQGTGLLQPSYTNNSTYAGNISTVGSTSIVNFSMNSGRTTLDGANAQSINGPVAFPPRFQRLSVNKSANNVSLLVPITIAVELDFTNRTIVSSASNLIVFEDNAVHVNTSNASFASGPVRKIGNDVWTFPVGKNNVYAPISITAPTSTAHHFTAEYFPINPNTVPYNINSKDPSLNTISQCEYWILDRTNGTSNVVVTLSWDTRSCGVTAMSDLRVARWDGAVWRDHGNGGTTGTTASGTIASSAAVTSFSPFTLASITNLNPLPIELLNFDAIKKDHVVEVNWQTATETNNDYFNLEKSPNGIDFSSIEEINGAGFSNHQISYQTFDYHPYQGLNYYRLKQTDFNGDYSYSPIRVVNYNSSSEYLVYPNPIENSTTTVVFTNDNLHSISLSLINSFGQVLLSKTYSFNGEKLSLELPRELATGLYFLQIMEGDEIYNSPVIIK